MKNQMLNKIIQTKIMQLPKIKLINQGNNKIKMKSKRYIDKMTAEKLGIELTA